MLTAAHCFRQAEDHTLWRVIVGKAGVAQGSQRASHSTTWPGPGVPEPGPARCAVLLPGDPGSSWGKEYHIEREVIHPGFDVYAKKNQGIPEFYGDDIALLKLAQKVKMSTHARCPRLGQEGAPQEPVLRRDTQGTPEMGLCDTRSSPQAHLPSLHHGGQHGVAETPGQHL